MDPITTLFSLFRFGGFLKWIGIGVAGFAAFWFVRDDAADDARAELTAEIKQESLEETVRQKDVAQEAQAAAAEKKAQDEVELEELIDDLPDIAKSDGCVVPDDLSERLLRID